MRSLETPRRRAADVVFQVSREADLLLRSHGRGRTTAPGPNRHEFRDYGENRRCGWPTRILVAGLAALAPAIGIGPAAAAVTSVTAQMDIQFGSTVPDPVVSGTAIINTSGGKSTTGGAFDLGGATRAARFRLIGGNSSAYVCTLPGTIQVTSGGNTADVDSFTASQPLSGILPGNGRLTIDVGATLQLPAGLAAGSYTGTVTMTCDAVQGTNNVTATVASMISISSVTSLDFGIMSPTVSSGTVTISTTGTRSSANVDLIVGITSAAQFDVSGEAGLTYSISLPVSTTLIGPGTDMVVDTFVNSAVSQLSGGGTDTFNVGATLHVGGSQASGTYTGTFPVTANYN